MRNRLVYDLPQRAFHWLFASLFTFSFVVAKNVDSESPVYMYHMLAGFLLGFIVLLRILWGLAGAKYSRFSSFALNPKQLVSYFKGIIFGDKYRWLGHNPASSWAALAMLTLTMGLAVTGFFMANGDKENFEDIHEVFADGFFIVVLMHVAGVFFHLIRYRDGIALSMVDGHKKEIAPSDSIQNPRKLVALVFVVMVILFGGYLIRNFNQEKRALNFWGTHLQLGEIDN